MGDDKILLSFSDMLDWGRLSKNFPMVPRKSEKVRKVSIPKKKTKKTPVARGRDW